MYEVVTWAPRSSRSSGASRRVSTLHRFPLGLATALNVTFEVSRDTLEPDVSLPERIPSPTTPAAVARKRVILAEIVSFDVVAWLAEDGLVFAPADDTRTAAKASAA